MTCYAGVDIGSRSSKAVIIDGNGRIVAWSVQRTTPDGEASARAALNAALVEASIGAEGLQRVVATGYGRVTVSFAQDHVTEISCHARGVHWLFPDARTILDMGGQDCKVICCNENGKVVDFLMNDKCAAGTGRYLERIAKIARVPLDEFGPLSLDLVEGECNVKSYCSVFAETDVIMLLHEGKHRNDILGGTARAIVERIKPMIDRLGMRAEFAISGGVAKNTGVVRRLEDFYGIKARIAFDSQVVGALGAALYARSGAPDEALEHRQASVRRRREVIVVAEQRRSDASCNAYCQAARAGG